MSWLDDGVSCPLPARCDGAAGQLPRLYGSVGHDPRFDAGARRRVRPARALLRLLPGQHVWHARSGGLPPYLPLHHQGRPDATNLPVPVTVGS